MNYSWNDLPLQNFADAVNYCIATGVFEQQDIDLVTINQAAQFSTLVLKSMSSPTLGAMQGYAASWANLNYLSALVPSVTTTMIADNSNIQNTSSGPSDFVEINTALNQKIVAGPKGVVKATLTLPAATEVELALSIVGLAGEKWLGLVPIGDGGASGNLTFNAPGFYQFTWIETGFKERQLVDVHPVFADFGGGQLEFYSSSTPPPTYFSTVTFILETY